MGITQAPQNYPGGGNYGSLWAGFSAHAQLLPYMEQTPLYNATNFSWACFIPPNDTTYLSIVSSLLCPSDPNAGRRHSNSYAASYGATTSTMTSWNNAVGDSQANANQPLPGGSSGMFTYGDSYGIRDATDGTSSTIAYAEWLTGNQGVNYDGAATGSKYRGNFIILPSGMVAGSDVLNASGNVNAVLQSVQACRTAFNTPGQAGIHDFKGWRWSHGASAFGMFNTIQPPNDTFGGCRFSADVNGWPDNSYVAGASSAHPGGLNCAFGDGSVKFIKSTINLQTWWSLGTRAGGEILSADAY